LPYVLYLFITILKESNYLQHFCRIKYIEVMYFEIVIILFVSMHYL